MLEGLDDIDWGQLSAWGDATKVPGRLRAIAVAPRELLAAAEADTEDVVRIVAWTAAALVSPESVPPDVHQRFLDAWAHAGQAWSAARSGIWPYPLPELWQAWAR